jgi:hypothetical protein
MSNEHPSPIKKALEGLDLGKQIALLTAFSLQLLLIAVALWTALSVAFHFAPGASTPWDWTVLILGMVLAFVYAYLIAVLALRLLIPYTPEGFFARGPGGRPPPQAILLMLNIILTKVRYEPPWSGMFSAVLSNLFPLRQLYRRLFGPHTPSNTLGDTTKILDPYLLYAGRDVQFGFGCTIGCHIFDHRGLYVKRVVIEDGATVGAEAMIMPGVHIGRGATVAARSLVPANTVIGPYEYWAGAPAKLVKTLKPRTERDPAGGA